MDESASPETVLEGNPFVELDADVLEGNPLENPRLCVANFAIEQRQGVIGIRASHKAPERVDVESTARTERSRNVDEIEDLLDFNLNKRMAIGNALQHAGDGSR